MNSFSFFDGSEVQFVCELLPHVMPYPEQIRIFFGGGGVFSNANPNKNSNYSESGDVYPPLLLDHRVLRYGVRYIYNRDWRK